MESIKKHSTIIKILVLIIIIIAGVGGFIAIRQYKNRLTVGGYHFYYVEGTISNMGNYYVDVDSTKIYSDEIYSGDIADNTFTSNYKQMHISLKGASRDVYRVGSKVKVTTFENPFTKDRISCIGLMVLEF